jgi:hypothetical protein
VKQRSPAASAGSPTPAMRSAHTLGEEARPRRGRDAATSALRTHAVDVARGIAVEHGTILGARERVAASVSGLRSGP